MESKLAEINAVGWKGRTDLDCEVLVMSVIPRNLHSLI